MNNLHIAFFTPLSFYFLQTRMLLDRLQFHVACFLISALQYNFLSCFKVLMKQTVCTNQQPVMKYRPIRCNPGNVLGVQTKKVKIISNSSISSRADCILASELLRLLLVLSSLALFASCKPTDVSGQWFLGMWSQICLCKWSRPFLCLKKTNKQICHAEIIETLGKAKQLCSALLRIALASSASPKGIQEQSDNLFTTFS